MSFRYDGVLWLLALIPLAAAVLTLGYRRGQRADSLFARGQLADALIRGRMPRLRAARGVLIVAALTAAIMAWAGPQYGSRTRMMAKRGVDVVVALDFSKSMLAKDVQPSRIERSKAELGRFFDELGGDRVGVVAFAGDTMEFPMTTDYSAVKLFLRDLGPYDMPVGGTAIGRALVSAKRLLLRSAQPAAESPDTPKQPARSRMVILITDGEDHEGDPASAAKELAELGIVLHVVAIGSTSGEPIPTYAQDGTWTGYLRDRQGEPVLSALTPDNERALAALAKSTRGELFRAAEGSVGVDAIRRLMRGMKQQEHKARKVRIAEDRYALVLLLAFLLLLGEALLPDGRLTGSAGGST